MTTDDFLVNTIIYLGVAVISVPIARKLGLSSILGYLIAGIVIGPWGFQLIHDPESVLHFAEFGVVMFLFLIGLELDPQRLWRMRYTILGLGGAQMLFSILLIFGLALLFNVSWVVALLLAMALSPSSTAIGVQTLNERNLLPTQVGSSSFSILLFQDIAVIPMLALIPLLGAAELTNHGAESGSFWQVLLVIGGIILFGRYLIRPIFRLIASTDLHEMFTAFSLMIVIGIALLMNWIGMSMALGTFLAGVLLADSEYRHELETNILPFKGILLGLFFISVGMSIDISILQKMPWLVLGLVFLLTFVKALVLFIIATIIKLPSYQRPFFALLLAHGGEFAFVLLGIGLSSHIITDFTADLIFVVIAFSMLMTPILLIINDRIIEKYFIHQTIKPPADLIDDNNNPVIIAGFGRVGQVVFRVLNANKITTTILDHDPEHVERVRRLGFKVFYGDAGRLDLLHAAGIEQAKILILAIDDKDKVTEIAAIVKEKFPHITVIARAWDMLHSFDLMDRGVHVFQRETVEDSLSIGEKALKILGFGAYEVKKKIKIFREHELNMLYLLYEHRKFEDDPEKRIRSFKDFRAQEEKLYEKDQDIYEDKSWG